MKLLLTGGNGDLGTVLAPRIAARGDRAVLLDVRAPQLPVLPAGVAHLRGSILDRAVLAGALRAVDVVVHIAAWHGIHLVRQEKDVFDFWELNVTGMFNVLELTARAGCKKLVHISSTSVDEWPDVYGSSKLLGEELARTYAARHGIEVINLRPRAFIPHWNRAAYQDYVEWARWFWRGAVHIDDVAQAVLQSIDLLVKSPLAGPLTLPVDGAYDFSAEDLRTWDSEGPGTTFARVYPGYQDLLFRHDLDASVKPSPLDIRKTRSALGYTPRFGLGQLLSELETHGAQGPPAL